jgi:hypothetical protein
MGISLTENLMMNIFRVNVLPRTLLAFLVRAGLNFNVFMKR